ncbi:MAG: methyltransferase domain-containing protein [Deltaproteobacteria bacterium]|nr:methyltransferase domain-containing protein [Deltaproteobacteria bacterium]MBI3391380.1 methyltransferase domain-containing protein [Deltaproteobacteria bacterium]
MDHDEPSFSLLWETFSGYQRTAVLKAAVELDIFAQIAGGAVTIDALAALCRAAPRGLRALLNHLAMDGFLTRDGERYGLRATAAAFLDRNSPAYLGSAIGFIASPMIIESLSHLTDAVRRGGTAIPDEGTLAPEHPVWVEFARAMAPLAGMTAGLLANLLDVEQAPGWKVLDIAAGHGMFGITLARLNPNVTVTALDWKKVLAVANEHARAADVSARFHTLAGSAFDVPFGDGYDLVLLPNFLHHFDPPTCERLLIKARAALAPGGRVVIVEFVPNDDRSGPPDAVRFSLIMLASTPSGDAYTFAEYQTMLQHAGFARVTLHELLPSPARVVIAER